MNVKARLEKLEQATADKTHALIFVNDGETQEEAYKRYFPDDTKRHDRVIFLSEGDKLI